MFKFNSLDNVIEKMLEIENIGINIPISSKTTNGLDININYKPTIGIIFFTKSEGFNIENIIEIMVKKTLDNKYRTISSSSNVLIQSNNDTKEIIYVENTSNIKYFSENSGFTWILTLADNSFELFNTKSLKNINFSLSSIMYDSGNIFSDFTNKFNPNDFKRDDVRNILDVYEGGLIINSNTGSINYTTNFLTHNFQENKQENKQIEKWNPSEILIEKDATNNNYIYSNASYREYKCINCETPLYGEVVCLSDIKISDKKKQIKKNRQSLLKNVSINSKILICTYCWDEIKICTGHGIYLHSNVTYTIMPFCQSETALACGYHLLEDILKSKAICVAEGVFFLQNLKKYITSEKLGLYPEFTYPQLKGMSIITNVQIIEYC
jgi:hypothetical protein